MSLQHSFRLFLPCAFLLTGNIAWANDAQRLGDQLQYVSAAAVLGYEAVHGDGQGLKQFASSYALTLAGTEVLKRATQVQRPDGRDDLSFPSGHAAKAFGPAAYVHRRYGLAWAAPHYVLATYVGWTRVQARRHRWADVAGSAALSLASAWWLVEPHSTGTNAAGVSVLPMLSTDGASLWVQARW